MVARVRRSPLLALGLLLACSPAGSGNSASATTGPASTTTGDEPTGGDSTTGDVPVPEPEIILVMEDIVFYDQLRRACGLRRPDRSEPLVLRPPGLLR